MPAAQKFISSEGLSGVVNLRRSKVGRKGEGKWKKKYAVLKRDTLHLYEGHDEYGKGEDESHTVYLSKYKECSQIIDKKGKKKPGFMLIPTDPSYEQWMLSCEDVNQEERWISQLNSAISGNLITIVNFNFDELTVQSPTLEHLGKTRPKCKGRRAPSKRPRTAMSEDYDDFVYAADDWEIGLTTTDSVNPAKKARPDLSTTLPLSTKSPEESRATAAKAFFRGLGQKVSNAFVRQKSTGAKTPQSPEPEGAGVVEVAPEDRMSLSALMRTLQRIEDTSGSIVNKAAALRVLFQGAAEDSASLGRPALEVKRGLEGITETLEHLNLAEELQLKVKEEEEKERLSKEEAARIQREKEEAQRWREEEERKKREAEEAEQRRRDEEEQELRDEEDRKQEEERIQKEEEERRAKEEALRHAEEAGAEEEKMWESQDEEKEGTGDMGETKAPDEAAKEVPESNEATDDKASTEEIHNDESKTAENAQENPPAEDGETEIDDGEAKMEAKETEANAVEVENAEGPKEAVEEMDSDAKTQDAPAEANTKTEELGVHL